MAEQDRTVEFFNLSVADLAEVLQDRVLIDLETHRKVQLARLEPYPKVGARYRDIIGKRMQPGELWTPYIPVRRMSQSLIIAKSIETGVGACVRIVRVNLDKDVFVPAQREGDLASYLEFGKFERAHIRFLDESKDLYIVRAPELNQPDVSENIHSDDANNDLTKLLQK